MFSWTFFFFGLFVPLIRGDLRWAIIMFLLQLLSGIFTLGIGFYVVSLIFSFIYNIIYIKGLEKGYHPTEYFNEAVTNYINR